VLQGKRKQGKKVLKEDLCLDHSPTSMNNPDMLRKLLDVCIIPAQMIAWPLPHLQAQEEVLHGAAAAEAEPGELAQAWQQEQAWASVLHTRTSQRVLSKVCYEHQATIKLLQVT
jgi:hypothetical protein